MNAGEKIIVGLSGGVDSAVAALLLLRAGYCVEALHMTNWEEDDAYCTAAADFQDARQVCAELGIPLHRVNFTQAYRDQVFADFLREYQAGRTPNPDVLCNRHIKFGAFLEHARRLGASRIATGHYARIDSGSPTRLLKGTDPNKDQSYFLHAVSSQALGASLFPLGELRKPDVRDIATAAGLPVHEKRDSTGICFIGERPFRQFLSRYLEGAAGPMLTPDGDYLGDHSGLMHYTIGQRRGLAIGGQAGGDGAGWYVAGKDTATNALRVVQGRGHPLLWSAGLTASRAHWIAGEPASLTDGLRCAVRSRYRQRETGCLVTCSGEQLVVRFDSPQWAVAPGQYAVFYDGPECLGGALIESALPLDRSSGALLSATA